MPINGIGSTNTYIYKNRNKSNNHNKGNALFDRVGAATDSNSRKILEQSRLTAYSAYCGMSSRFSNRISVSNLGVQISKDLEAVQNDKYAISIYTEEGIKGHWRIYNKETGKIISFDPKLTSTQIDPETGKKYLTELSGYGGFMGVWRLDSSLEELLTEFVGVDELQYSDINNDFTLERDATTGILSIYRKGAEGGCGDMIIEDEEQAKKLEELANLYLEKYPSLVTSMEMALNFFAKGEVMGWCVRDETGVLCIATGGMVYYNAQDPLKGWGIQYSGFDSTIYSKVKEAFSSGTITGNMVSDYKKWVEWLTEKEIDFLLTTTEEELERLKEENYSEWLRITSSLSDHSETSSAESQSREVSDEGQTKSEIVVRPDGSRILMITMSIGDMETVMSIEIAEPTVGGILSNDIKGDTDVNILMENMEDNTSN